jgi:hypothetical protein
MKIQFNKVTWYSKLLSFIFLVIIVPIITFYIGMEYQKTVFVLENNRKMSAEMESANSYNTGIDNDGMVDVMKQN